MIINNEWPRISNNTEPQENSATTAHSSTTIAINNENLEALKSDSKPLVIDFWAEWCGPCRTIAPIVDELSAEYEGKVNIGKCDVDSNDDIVAEFRVRNIPTIIFFKNGEQVDKHVGAISKADLKAKIDALL